ncbi:MAG: protein adenylyltransferase SelO [Planctomycetota bacterium]
MTSAALGWNFDNSYGRLPDAFYSRQRPTPVAAPQLVVFQPQLAAELGISGDYSQSDLIAAQLAGNEIPAGADPLAQAYAGCQYGHFTMLGDGRAILLGEQQTPTGQRVDVQLKGAGRTAYSRGGDGRAALGPMLREFVISEAMVALGIPTTRSLAVVATGEPVYRERTLPGAILTRIAASHLRVGTFELFAARRDHDALRRLVAYAMQRHTPELLGKLPREPVADGTVDLLSAAVVGPTPSEVVQFFDEVMRRQIELMVKWLSVGFVHGVMNTDNMAISGETIDYGPCAFMDRYDPETVFSSIDRHGRYAFGNQPAIAQWNLARLAESLLPLMGDSHAAALDQAVACLSSFTDRFQTRWRAELGYKLGLSSQLPTDAALAQRLLAFMQRAGLDYTNTWRALMSERVPCGAAFADGEFQAWYADWQLRLEQQPDSRAEVWQRMSRHNPVVIPRNHQVEAVLAAASDHGDLAPLHRLLAALARPYDDDSASLDYRDAGPTTDVPYRTFFGT